LRKGAEEKINRMGKKLQEDGDMPQCGVSRILIHYYQGNGINKKLVSGPCNTYC
jgi:hypothetical protein